MATLNPFKDQSEKPLSDDMEMSHKKESEVLPEVGNAFNPAGNPLVEQHPYLVGYVFLISVAILGLRSHLIVFFMSFLFLYLISDFMTNDVHRYFPFVPKVLLFSVLYISVATSITIITYRLIPNLVIHFPEIANRLQTEVINQFNNMNQRWDLSPYIDLEEIRSLIKSTSAGVLRFLIDSLSPLYKGFVQFVFALVLNLLFYHESDRVKETLTRKPGSMMSFFYYFTEIRLRIFYYYFKQVMGGQMIISAANTAISTPIIIMLGLHHPLLMIFTVFFCGLFPVVGNLVSNSVLIINAFVFIGLWASGVCLVLLVIIHKLEYFLNSRIIGGIVRLPMAISLAALIICEVIFGIPGLILAIPFILFLRHELENLSGCADDACHLEFPKRRRK